MLFAGTSVASNVRLYLLCLSRLPLAPNAEELEPAVPLRPLAAAADMRAWGHGGMYVWATRQRTFSNCDRQLRICISMHAAA